MKHVPFRAHGTSKNTLLLIVRPQSGGADATGRSGSNPLQNRCADCHGGDGLKTYEGPPVWGDQSYNDGAGLSRVPKLASWLKVAMPLNDAILTTQEALDIAAFVNSHDRPRFVLSEHLSPKDRGERNNGKQSIEDSNE